MSLRSWTVILLLLTWAWALPRDVRAEPRDTQIEPESALDCQSLAGEHRFVEMTTEN
jgi:hypothetical protein